MLFHNVGKQVGFGEEFQMSGNVGIAEQPRPTARAVSPVRITVSRAVVRVPLDASSVPAQSAVVDTADAVCPWRMVTVVPGRPFVSRFRTQKLAEGLRSLLGVCFGLGAGIFLLTHIPGTPNLRLQVTFVAVVCLVLGCVLVPFAAGYLLGRLRLDSFGISMSPWPIGFSIRWQDLVCWSVEGLQLHLVSRRSSKEEIVPLHVLASADRLLVRDILRACAGEREGRMSAVSAVEASPVKCGP
jgi:hypothetical protein